MYVQTDKETTLILQDKGPIIKVTLSFSEFISGH